MSKPRITGIAAAIRKFGTQKKMAEATGYSQQLISTWLVKGRVPAERVVEISQRTGIPKKVLRPDLFGDQT